MRNIIWRNRASAILGVMVLILPFTGFPESIQTVLFMILGGLIALFGFTSNRYAAELNDVADRAYEPRPTPAARVDEAGISEEVTAEYSQASVSSEDETV